MNQLKEIITSPPKPMEEDTVRVPNQYGCDAPSICVQIDGKTFSLGGISESAEASRFDDGWLIWQNDKGTAYVLLFDGSIYVHDLEDEKIQIFDDKIVFYSDAGITQISKCGEITCAFNDLNEYFISICFSRIAEGLIEFTKGNEIKISSSLDDLISHIGVESCTDKFEP